MTHRALYVLLGVFMMFGIADSPAATHSRATVGATGVALARAGRHAVPPASDIRAQLDSTAAGWNRGDLSRYLASYVDSATTMGATGLVRGVAGIEAQMRGGFWAAGTPAQKLHYENIEVRMLGKDYALVTGEYVLTGAGRPNRTGWFTTIWTTTRAGWRMMHDHS